jgi:hypothetical protein
MMEAVSTSETSVNFYETTRRNSLEDSHHHTHRREKLKSNQAIVTFSRKALLRGVILNDNVKLSLCRNSVS